MNLKLIFFNPEIYKRLSEAFTICALFLINFQMIEAVSIDSRLYEPSCGINIKASEDILVLQWDTPKGMSQLSLNVSGEGALVRSISIASGNDEPVVVLRDADPVTVLTIGQRDLKKRDGWNIFFDPTSRKPSRSGPLNLNVKSVLVRSEGNRCMVEIDELKGGSFSGSLRFTLYAGCELIHLQSIVQTQKDACAILYHSGITCDPIGKAVSWIGLDDKLQSTTNIDQTAKPVKVRHRTIALETNNGALAIFPPPHRYFYPLDEAYNLGFTWRGKGFMKKVPEFGIGIRQDLKGDDRWVPWFNAPPGTQQELGVFWLPSLERGNEIFDRVKAYTHNDRFPELQGHKTFTSHYHIEHTTNVLELREKPENFSSTEVVSTSRRTNQIWRYSLTEPPKDWMDPSFNDKEWKEGKGGFGKRGTPGLKLGTDWDTQDIWLRRRFKLGDVSIDMLKLSLLYDEDTEVFINGVLAFSVKGFSKKYREVSISSEARKTLKKGDNILAVHCWNDGGGQAIDVGLVIPSKNDPPKETFIPDFVDVFKKTGVQIVHLAEFHNHLGPKRHNAEDSLRLLKAMHDECARLSNENFLLLPGEEPNVHLGGHWISFFPRPVMWVLKRAANKPFIQDHPEYGRVYHLGSSQDVLNLMELEKGLMWAAHPRIKSSTGYPDRYRNENFFKSDRYLGGAWKAMPADLSRHRLGWRVLDLLDDTSNWGAKKYIVGEVDVFQVDRTTEFYAHANINYLRIDEVPNYRDGWGSVLKALSNGAFFISTGEILMPSFTIDGKKSGETMSVQETGNSKLEVDLSWTFPMSYYEIISGDGVKVYRERVELSEVGAFGEKTFTKEINLRGKKWVRFEAWDIATNGVISQPIWVE